MTRTFDRALPLVAGAALAASAWAALVWAPTERTMGNVQRIFYPHLGCAAAAFLAFAAVFASSLAFLFSRRETWDLVARSAAEVGVLFCSLVLVTGPLWGRAAWGRWWVWDPRLTTTLILWFLYFGYLVLRRALPGHRGALVGAVFAILAFADVPIVYLSVRWWRGIHPIVLGQGGGLASGMVAPLLVNVAAFAALMSVLLRERYLLGRLEARTAEAELFSGKDSP